MNFDDIYPLTTGFFKASDGFARGAGATAECVVCGRPTHWFHRDLALYFCSTECFAQFRDDRPGLCFADQRRGDAARKGHQHAGAAFALRWPSAPIRAR
ncbi:MAG TPA: hypothetical protein VGX76_04555 [Pirellulales bacterium]|nr:hypothetical protein [Pirellulales bacterium]